MSRFTPPIRRHETAKGHYYKDATGARVPGVTTIQDKGVPKPALINWAAKVEREMVIEAAANLWEDAPLTTKKMSRAAYVATLTDRIEQGIELIVLERDVCDRQRGLGAAAHRDANVGCA